MPNRLSHEELYQAYLELQARVTQFSSKEQELINVRDQLDQELVAYKRMNDFHAAAIEVHDVSDLLALIAETVVDLFETEMGYACFEDPNHPDGHIEHLEGGRKSMGEEYLWSLRAMSRKAHPSSYELSQDGEGDGILSRYFVGRRSRVHSGLDLVVIGAVSQDRDETYNRFNTKVLTRLKLFMQSCSAYLENILAADRINEQLETIRRSEVEQRRLSLIATKTHSGVIIADEFGRIVWVNEAFLRSTGYISEEVMGRKPKEFLQGPGLNDPEVLQRLSEALWKRENISVNLRNRKKDGEVFFIQLNITPVFDQDDRHSGFIAIQQDVTTQMMHEEHIMEKNEELTKINKELDQFVYSISHDLRAPLLSIQGLLGLIEVDSGDEANLEYLSMISESVKRLDHTILEILNYSRNTRLEVQMERFDLRKSIGDVLQDLSSLRQDAEVRIEWQGDEEVVLDEVRVGVLLKNILSNALKYSNARGEQPRVLVDVVHSDHGIVIRVEDNGEGIDPRHHEKVFDMFYRATHSSSGTGLGLYISREIAEKLGGTITLDSIKGEGTTVTITLPTRTP